MTSFFMGSSLLKKALPAQACDCHMHVFDHTYPSIPHPLSPPPDAGVADYSKLKVQLGHTRNVVVQPSLYGMDNSLLLATLQVSPETSRGACVIDETVSDKELRLLDIHGVVGVRFNQVYPGATRLTMLPQIVPRLKELNWHVQFYLSTDQLIDSVDLLADLAVPVVLDHFARACSAPTQMLQLNSIVKRLLRSGNVWMKLSAPYLAGVVKDVPYGDLAEFTNEIVADFPDRLLRGSDWPHGTEQQMPDDVVLLDWLQSCMPSETTQKQVFVTNPEKLYRFWPSMQAARLLGC